MFNPRSIKAQLIIFLFLLAGFVVIKDKEISFLFAFMLCVATAVFIEAVVLYFKTHKWQVTESAVIAGAIVGFVASSGIVWWKLVAVVAVAILSKHFIRWRNKHVFNPAAFGLLMAVIILGVPAQWKATYLWYFLVPFGGYLAWKMRRLEVLAGYAVVSLLAFGSQALLQHAALVDMLGYFSYFYIFIMIVEPKTTPAGGVPKYLFGGLLAGLIFALTQSSLACDIELLSLLIMNMAVPLLNKIVVKKGV
ncbi:MAG: RnfABCDGE type electron transport complex subunit D [Candidatus Omnitrophota bacterium]